MIAAFGKKSREGKHPIYEAVRGDEVPGGPFTAAEQVVITAIRDGNAVPYAEKGATEALKARGIVRERNKQRSNGKRFQSTELDDAAITALSEPLAVWLPNALIDGAAGEVPPIERIRQTRRLPALRLLVELYAVQFLPHYGGVPREMLCREFDRVKVGQQGAFVVWGFESQQLSASRDLARPFFTGEFTTENDGKRWDSGWDEVFFPAVHALASVGIVECVGMLLDGDDPEAEIIHPYAMRGGEPAERELARAASEAAAAMLTEGQVTWAEDRGYHLVPVQQHISKATLVEIFRLRYRPHTKATGAWFAKMKESTAEYLPRYKAIIRDRAAAISAA